MGSLKQNANPPPADFERETRRIIKGIKAERRWRSRYKEGFFSRIRRRIAQALEWLAGLILVISHRVDSWNTTVENVLEHTFKQTLLIMKMLVIEAAHGNQHGLDFFILLQWAILHDLPEGEPDFSDVNFWSKRESEKSALIYRKIEEKIHHRIAIGLFSLKYKDYFPLNIDIGHEVLEEEKIFWEASECIGHCLFMLEEISIGRISLERRMRFHDDIADVHLDWMKKNAWHFVSVREIVETEIMPKWEAVQNKAL